MRPARSRRVQAQRKFAQGAYVPPNVVAVPATDNRRDAAQDARNVTMNNMTATSLLDVVSMQGLHTHLQPVVLMERLCGRTRSRDEPPRRETVQPRPREILNVATIQKSTLPKLASVKRKKEYKRTHQMALRSRRLSKLMFNRMLAQSLTPTRKVVVKRKALQVTTPRSKKKNLGERLDLINAGESEFTFEDDRPLTYYINDSSTPKRSPNVGPVVLPNNGPVVQPNVSSVVQQNLDSIVQPEFAYPEPVAGPSGLQKKVGDRTSSQIDSYYSNIDKIHSWMNNATVGRPMRQKMRFQAPAIKSYKKKDTAEVAVRVGKGDNVAEKTVTVNLADDLLLTCIAENWRSVQDVINAPQEDLDSRCQQCKSCERIEKLIKLSDLLKTTVKVDLTGNPVLSRNSTNDVMMSAEIDNGHLYLELLPKHPTYMMKLRIHMVHGKEILSACLIPKRDARRNQQEFLLEEQEHLLDQLIETLTLSLNDESSNRRLSISSIESIEGSDITIPLINHQEEQERRRLHRQKVADAATRIAETTEMQARMKAEEKAEVARIEQEKREEIRIQAEKQIEAKRNIIAVEVCRMAEEREAELARLRAEIRAEIEADRRMRDEVDDMARVLEKEKDAKAMNPGPCSEPDINTPSTSGFTAEGGKLMEAPIFRPSKEEFFDPIGYFMKIWPQAYKYGLCKVVPPKGWKPKCKVQDDMRFDVTNQYVSRLYSRWGPAARELCAIKLCLKTQKISFTRPPLLDGVEVNLPKLYHLVQRHGGLETVINKKRWGRVAEDMKFTKNTQTERRLDQIYVKYLLPYDTLSHEERQEIMRKVEKAWNKKNQKLLDRAMNPLHRQKCLMGLSDTSSDECDDNDTAFALHEAEDCIIKGAITNRAKFRKLATNAYENVFGPGSESAQPPELQHIEDQYWRQVLLGTEHLCVHTAAIDTGDEGYGFTKNQSESYGRHLWNLKMMSENPDNVLRYLGPVLGVTVPTLHLGMLFSTSCWHKDPHALPWKEYQHSGPTRIWYGIPSTQADNFRKAVETVCPTSCQNKALWLPTDITMIPPQVLRDNNVTLSRVTQEAGEFIIAFPKSYTCCISTGYTESESVYFAPRSWLETMPDVFKEARDSCEPTMFSMEKLLYLIGKDERTDPATLKVAHPIYEKMLRDEVTNRQMLQERGLALVHASATTRRKRSAAYNTARSIEECEYCKATLFLSKVIGLTSETSVLCLEHALKLLETDKYMTKNVKDLEVLVLVSVKELNAVSDKMKDRMALNSPRS